MDRIETTCVFVQKGQIIIHDLWAVNWRWPGLMQPLSIHIAPASCAYDTLDIPQHAKSSLIISLFLPTPPST